MVTTLLLSAMLSASAPAAEPPAKLELFAQENGKKDDKPAAKELKPIATGGWPFASANPDDKTGPKQYVVRSAEDLAKAANQKDADKVKEQLLKVLKVKDVDWKTQMLIVVTGGVQSSGGYSLDVTGLEVKDKVLTVKWKLNPPKGAATAAFTHPATVVLIERFEGEVKFDPAAPKEKEK